MIGLIEDHVEGEPKRHDDKQHEDDHLAEDVEDVQEHEHVDASDGQPTDVGHERDPGEKHRHHANLPLPHRHAQAP